MSKPEKQSTTVTLSISDDVPIWYRAEWRDSGFDPLIADSLAKIQESIYGIEGITTLLYDDQSTEEHAAQYDNVDYTPLKPQIVEGLQCAQRALISLVNEELENLRERNRKFSANG